MSATDIEFASEKLREAAQPWNGGEKIKTVIARAANRAGLSYWRAFDIWYGKARRIEPHERTQILNALVRKEVEAGRNDFHKLELEMAALKSRLNLLAAQLDGKDTDLFGNEVRGRNKKTRP